MGRRAVRILAVTVLAGLAAAVPVGVAVAAGGDAPKIRTFVGEVPDSDAFIGIVTQGATVRAYLCDGQQISEWFNGEKSDDELVSDGGATLVADYGSKRVEGTVTLADGTALEFEAKKAKKKAAVYRGEGAIEDIEYLAGWVVLANGEQRGAVGFGKPAVVFGAPQLTVSRTPKGGAVSLEDGGGLGISCTGAGCSIPLGGRSIGCTGAGCQIRFEPGGGLG